MANPWDVAPLAPHGDDSTTTIFQAVGLALTEWASLEIYLAQFFGILVGSRKGAAEAFFGTIDSFPMRMSAIRTAIDLVLVPEKPILQELCDLLNTIAQLNGRRNDIAHGVATMFLPGGGIGIGGHFMAPGITKTKKADFRKGKALRPDLPFPFNFLAYSYTSGQMIGYAMIFREYATKLLSCVDAVRVFYGTELGARP